jgi:uncharacterized membrane protein YfcA
MQAMQNFNVDLLLGLPIMLGGVLGAQKGVTMAGRIRQEELRVMLALLVLGISLRMGFDLVRKPGDIYSVETIEVLAKP